MTADERALELQRALEITFACPWTYTLDISVYGSGSLQMYPSRRICFDVRYEVPVPASLRVWDHTTARRRDPTRLHLYGSSSVTPDRIYTMHGGTLDDCKGLHVYIYAGPQAEPEPWPARPSTWERLLTEPGT